MDKKKSVTYKVVSLIVCISFILQDISFALAPTSKFDPICRPQEKEDGSYEVVVDKDIADFWANETDRSIKSGEVRNEKFREEVVSREIMTIIAHFLRKKEITQLTVIPAIKNYLGAEKLAQIKESDPILSGCAIDELAFDRKEPAFYLPIYRNGQKVFQYKFFLADGKTSDIAEKETKKAFTQIPFEDGKNVYMKIEYFGLSAEQESFERKMIAVRSIVHAASMGTEIVNPWSNAIMFLGMELVEKYFPETKEIVVQGRETLNEFRNVCDQLERTADPALRGLKLDGWLDELAGLQSVINTLVKKYQGVYSIRTSVYRQKEISQEDIEKLERYLTSACREMELASSILSNRMRFAGGISEKNRLDIIDVIKRAASFSVYTEERTIMPNVNITTNISAPVYIEGEMPSVINAFSNIINNGIYAGENRFGERGRARVEINIAQEDGKIVISMKDNGAGIKPDLLEMGPNGRLKLFDLDNTTKEKGTGLGTTESWYVVKDLGGTIDVRSIPGEGSTFVITLPLVQPKDESVKESFKVTVTHYDIGENNKYASSAIPDDELTNAITAFFESDSRKNTDMLLEKVIGQGVSARDIEEITVKQFQHGRFYRVYKADICLKDGRKGICILELPIAAGKCNSLLTDDFKNLSYYHKKFPDNVVPPLLCREVHVAAGEGFGDRNTINILALQWLGNYVELNDDYGGVASFELNWFGREPIGGYYTSFSGDVISSSNVLSEIAKRFTKMSEYDQEKGTIDFIDQVRLGAGDVMLKPMTDGKYDLKLITIRAISRGKRPVDFLENLLCGNFVMANNAKGEERFAILRGVAQGLAAKYGIKTAERYFRAWIDDLRGIMSSRYAVLDATDKELQQGTDEVSVVLNDKARTWLSSLLESDPEMDMRLEPVKRNWIGKYIENGDCLNGVKAIIVEERAVAEDILKNISRIEKMDFGKMVSKENEARFKVVDEDGKSITAVSTPPEREENPVDNADGRDVENSAMDQGYDAFSAKRFVHQNALTTDDFILPERILGVGAVHDANIMDILARSLAEILGDTDLMLNPRGSIVYACRDGKIQWDIVRHIDIYCYVSRETFDRIMSLATINTVLYALSEKFRQNGVNAVYENERLYIIDSEDRRYPITVKFGEFEWLLDGSGYKKYDKTASDKSISLFEYRSFENYFCYGRASDIFNRVLHSVPCDEMERKAADVWNTTYKNLYGDAVDIFRPFNFIKSFISPRKFEKYLNRSLKRLALLAYLKNEWMFMGMILEILSADPGRKPAGFAGYWYYVAHRMMLIKYYLMILSPVSVREKWAIKDPKDMIEELYDDIPQAVRDRIERTKRSDAERIYTLSRRIAGRWHLDLNTDDFIGQYAAISSNSVFAPNMFIIGYRDNHGEVQGYALSSYYTQTHYAVIQEVALSKRAEGKGIAKALVATALKELMNKGAETVEVNVINPAIGKTLEKYGFEYVPGDNNGIFYRDSIHVICRYVLKLSGRRGLSNEDMSGGGSSGTNTDMPQDDGFWELDAQDESVPYTDGIGSVPDDNVPGTDIYKDDGHPRSAAITKTNNVIELFRMIGELCLYICPPLRFVQFYFEQMYKEKNRIGIIDPNSAWLFSVLRPRLAPDKGAGGSTAQFENDDKAEYKLPELVQAASEIKRIIDAGEIEMRFAEYRENALYLIRNEAIVSRVLSAKGTSVPQIKTALGDDDDFKVLSVDTMGAIDLAARAVLNVYIDKINAGMKKRDPVNRFLTKIRIGSKYVNTYIHDPYERTILMIMIISHCAIGKDAATGRPDIGDREFMQASEELLREGIIDQRFIMEYNRCMQNAMVRISEKKMVIYGMPNIEDIKSQLCLLYPEMPAQKMDRLAEHLRQTYKIIEANDIEGATDCFWATLFSMVNMRRFECKDMPVPGKNVVEARLHPAAVVSLFEDVRRVIAKEYGKTDDLKMVAFLSASDVTTSVLATGARQIWLYDAMPFNPDKEVSKYLKWKIPYICYKAREGYVQHEIFDAIGNAKVPILWELEALGAKDISITEESETVHHITFRLVDGVEREIIYTQKFFKTESEVTAIINDVQPDILVKKADLNFKLLANVELPPVVVNFDGSTIQGYHSFNVGGKYVPRISELSIKGVSSYMDFTKAAVHVKRMYKEEPVAAQEQIVTGNIEFSEDLVGSVRHLIEDVGSRQDIFASEKERKYFIRFAHGELDVKCLLNMAVQGKMTEIDLENYFLTVNVQFSRSVVKAMCEVLNPSKKSDVGLAGQHDTRLPGMADTGAVDAMLDLLRIVGEWLVKVCPPLRFVQFYFEQMYKEKNRIGIIDPNSAWLFSVFRPRLAPDKGISGGASSTGDASLSEAARRIVVCDSSMRGKLRLHAKKLSKGMIFLGMAPGDNMEGGFSYIREKGYVYDSPELEANKVRSHLGFLGEARICSYFPLENSAIAVIKSEVFNAMVARGNAGIEKWEAVDFNYPFIFETIPLEDVEYVLISKDTAEKNRDIFEKENPTELESLLRKKTVIIEPNEEDIADAQVHNYGDIHIQALMRFKREYGIREVAYVSVDDPLTEEPIFYVPAPVTTPRQAWDAIFSDEAHTRQFLQFVTGLRAKYPYDISKNDPRPPLEYAIENDLVFKIGENLYVTPITESFRRHLVFAKDEHGEIKFAFEVLIPGEDSDRKDIYASKRRDIALEINSAAPADNYCVLPLFQKELATGDYELYGGKYRTDEGNPLSVLAFAYDHDGKRMDFDSRKMMDRIFESTQGMTRQEFALSVIGQIARITAVVHQIGYSGHSATDSHESDTDYHLGNFRIFIVDGKPKVQLVGDFSGFKKLEEFAVPDQEIELDYKNIIETEYAMPGLSDLLGVPQNEMYASFRQALSDSKRSDGGQREKLIGVDANSQDNKGRGSNLPELVLDSNERLMNKIVMLPGFKVTRGASDLGTLIEWSDGQSGGFRIRLRPFAPEIIITCEKVSRNFAIGMTIDSTYLQSFWPPCAGGSIESVELSGTQMTGIMFDKETCRFGVLVTDEAAEKIAKSPLGALINGFYYHSGVGHFTILRESQFKASDREADVVYYFKHGEDGRLALPHPEMQQDGAMENPEIEAYVTQPARELNVDPNVLRSATENLARLMSNESGAIHDEAHDIERWLQAEKEVSASVGKEKVVACEKQVGNTSYILPSADDLIVNVRALGDLSKLTDFTENKSLRAASEMEEIITTLSLIGEVKIADKIEEYLNENRVKCVSTKNGFDIFERILGMFYRDKNGGDWVLIPDLYYYGDDRGAAVLIISAAISLGYSESYANGVVNKFRREDNHYKYSGEKDREIGVLRKLSGIDENHALATERNVRILLDVACGTNGSLYKGAIKLLKKYAKTNPSAFSTKNLKEVILDNGWRLKYFRKECLEIANIFFNANPLSFSEENLKIAFSKVKELNYDEDGLNFVLNELLPLFSKANPRSFSAENMIVFFNIFSEASFLYGDKDSIMAKMWRLFSVNPSSFSEKNLLWVLNIIEEKQTYSLRSSYFAEEVVAPLFAANKDSFTERVYWRIKGILKSDISRTYVPALYLLHFLCEVKGYGYADEYIEDKMRQYGIKKSTNGYECFCQLEKIYLQILPEILDLKGLGSQQLVRAIILKKLLSASKDNAVLTDLTCDSIKNDVLNKTIPGIKVIENIYSRVGRFGMSVYFPNGSPGAKMFEYISDMPAGQLHLRNTPGNEYLEARVHEGCLPVNILNVKYLYEIGAFMRNDLYYDNHRENFLLPFFSLTFFNDLKEHGVALYSVGSVMMNDLFVPAKGEVGFTGISRRQEDVLLPRGGVFESEVTVLSTQTSLGVEDGNGEFKLVYAKYLEFATYFWTAMHAYMYADKYKDKSDHGIQLKKIYSEFRAEFIDWFKKLEFDEKDALKVLGGDLLLDGGKLRYDRASLEDACNVLNRAVRESGKVKIEPLSEMIDRYIGRIKNVVIDNEIAFYLADKVESDEMSLDDIVPFLIDRMNTKDDEKIESLLHVAGGDLAINALASRESAGMRQAQAGSSQDKGQRAKGKSQHKRSGPSPADTGIVNNLLTLTHLVSTWCPPLRFIQRALDQLWNDNHNVGIIHPLSAWLMGLGKPMLAPDVGVGGNKHSKNESVDQTADSGIIENSTEYLINRSYLKSLAARGGFVPFLGSGVIPLYNDVNKTNFALKQVMSDPLLQAEILIWAVKYFDLDGIPAMMDLTIEHEAIILSLLGDKEKAALLEKLGRETLPVYEGTAHPQMHLTLDEAGVDWRSLTLDQVAKIDFNALGRMHIEAATIKELNDDENMQGKVKIGYVIGPYTLAGHLLGPNDVMMAPYVGGEELEKFNAIMEYSEAFIKRYVDLLIENGADVIAFLDPLPTPMLSPEDFKKWSVEPINRLSKYVRSKGALSAYHPCKAKVKETFDASVPSLAASDVDILSIDAIAPLREAYDAINKSCIEQGFSHATPYFIGNLNTDHLMPNGTPEEVASAVKELYDSMEGVPFICGTSCDADPTLANMTAAADSSRDSQKKREINNSAKKAIAELLKNGKTIIESDDGEKFVFELSCDENNLWIFVSDVKKPSQNIAYTYAWREEGNDAFNITHVPGGGVGMYVVDEYRGKYAGIGRTMMAIMIMLAQSKNMKKILVGEVSPGSVDFYKKMGFVSVNQNDSELFFPVEANEIERLNLTAPGIGIQLKARDKDKAVSEVNPNGHVGMTVVASSLQKYRDKKIVLLDDKDFVRESYTKLLKNHFNDVRNSGSVDGGLDIIREHLASGVRSEDIVVITDYQFRGSETALQLINALRIPENGEAFKGPIIIVSGSIVSHDEIPGFDLVKKDLNDETKKAYGLAYLEKNGQRYFRRSFLEKLLSVLDNPPDSAHFVLDQIKPTPRKDADIPQGIVYFEGGINDFESYIENKAEELSDALRPEKANEINDIMDTIISKAEFGKVIGDTFSRRVHDYKSQLHTIIAFDLETLKNKIGIDQLEESDEVVVKFHELADSLRGAFRNAGFIHKLLYFLGNFEKAGMYEPVLEAAILDYQKTYQGKTGGFDPNEGIARSLQHLKYAKDKTRLGELEAALIEWGHLYNDYSALSHREKFDEQLVRINENGAAFLASFANGLNRFFGEYIGIFGHMNLDGLEEGRLIGCIRVMDPAKSEAELLEDLKSAGEDDIVVLEQDYSSLSMAATRAGAFIFSRGGAIHIATRARAMGVPFIALPNAVKYLKELDGKWIVLESEKGKGRIRLAHEEEVNSRKTLKRSAIVVEPGEVSFEGPVVFSVKGKFPDESVEGVAKIAGEKIARQYVLSKNRIANVPEFTALTYKFYEMLCSHNKTAYEEIQTLARNINKSDPRSIQETLEKIRSIIRSMEIPLELMSRVSYPDYPLLILLRLSTNAEDMDKYPGVGAGVYGSCERIENPRHGGQAKELFKKALLDVYSSLWSDEAYADREFYNIDHFSVHPALEIQEYTNLGSYSVLIHTVDPRSKNPDIMEINIMPGSGRSLSSPALELQGEPWRYYYDKISGEMIGSDDPRKQYHPVMTNKKNYEDFIYGRISPLNPERFLLLNDEKQAMGFLLPVAKNALKCEGFFKKGQDIEGVISQRRGRGESGYYIEVVQSRTQGNVPPIDLIDEYIQYKRKKILFLRDWILEKDKERLLKSSDFYKATGFPDDPVEGDWRVDAMFKSLKIPVGEFSQRYDGTFNELTFFLKMLYEEDEFAGIRKGLVGRMFFYVVGRHDILLDYFHKLYSYDSELFLKVFDHSVPTMYRENDEIMKEFNRVNDFLIYRFLSNSRTENVVVEDIIKNVSLEALVQIVNQCCMHLKDLNILGYAKARGDYAELLSKLSPMVRHYVDKCEQSGVELQTPDDSHMPEHDEAETQMPVTPDLPIAKSQILTFSDINKIRLETVHTIIRAFDAETRPLFERWLALANELASNPPVSEDANIDAKARWEEISIPIEELFKSGVQRIGAEQGIREEDLLSSDPVKRAKADAMLLCTNSIMHSISHYILWDFSCNKLFSSSEDFKRVIADIGKVVSALEYIENSEQFVPEMFLDGFYTELQLEPEGNSNTPLGEFYVNLMYFKKYLDQLSKYLSEEARGGTHRTFEAFIVSRLPFEILRMEHRSKEFVSGMEKFRDKYGKEKYSQEYEKCLSHMNQYLSEYCYSENSDFSANAIGLGLLPPRRQEEVAGANVFDKKNADRMVGLLNSFSKETETLLEYIYGRVAMKRSLLYFMESVEYEIYEKQKGVQVQPDMPESAPENDANAAKTGEVDVPAVQTIIPMDASVIPSMDEIGEPLLDGSGDKVGDKGGLEKEMLSEGNRKDEKHLGLNGQVDPQKVARAKFDDGVELQDVSKFGKVSGKKDVHGSDVETPQPRVEVQETSARVINIGSSRQTLISASSGEKEQGIEDLFKKVSDALTKNNTNIDAVSKLVIFLRSQDERPACEEYLKRIFARGPPITTYLEEPPADGSRLAIEVTAIDGAEKTIINENMTVFTHDNIQWGYIGGVEPDKEAKDRFEQGLSVLNKVKKLLDNNGFALKNVMRFWNYAGYIIRKDVNGRQEYQKFNDARSRIFRPEGGETVHFGEENKEPWVGDTVFYPAATGIGIQRESLVMECLAVIGDRNDVRIEPLENPWQVDAHRYGEKDPEILETGADEKKKASPMFSRGMAVILREIGQKIIFVSGTASIEYSKNIHEGNTKEQTELAITNIERVLAQGRATLRDLTQIRVYIKDQADYQTIREVVERRLPDLPPASYVIADVCRPGLSVEIEAVAHRPYTVQEKLIDTLRGVNAHRTNQYSSQDASTAIVDAREKVDPKVVEKAKEEEAHIQELFETFRLVIDAEAKKRADEGRDKSEKDVIALGTSWIKGYGNIELRQARWLMALVCKLRGYKGFEFVVDDDADLAGKIEKVRKGNAKVIVLAGQTAISGASFEKLRNDTNVVMAAIANEKELTENSYYRIPEMLNLLLKLAYKDVFHIQDANLNIDPNIRVTRSGSVYLFFPPAKAEDPEQLELIYKFQTAA